MVDRVNVLHAVENDLAHFLQSLVTSHRSNRVTLNEHVTLGKQFDSL